MNRIQVYRGRWGNWCAECDAHGWWVFTDDHAAAYEAAAGHAAMAHPSPNRSIPLGELLDMCRIINAATQERLITEESA
jgi:hypothetical protein